MAIYSLHHSSIGKSTQDAPYTAGAHINYITRESAASGCVARRMPGEAVKAAAFFREREDALRKNARVADKLMLALPRELDATKRQALVAEFAEAITGGRAPWFAAFHDKGKDEKNPHCHLVIHDRDASTGKRVFGMSEKGSTQRLRVLWQEHANAALARAGRDERIDHRSLEAQGIGRNATIHVGVRSRQLLRRNWVPASRERILRNHCQARSRSRAVAYPAIDAGKLRLFHNIEIRRANMFASRATDTEEDYWKAIDEEAFLRDIRELRRLNAVLEYGPDGVTPQRSRERDVGGLEL